MPDDEQAGWVEWSAEQGWVFSRSGRPLTEQRREETGLADAGELGVVPDLPDEIEDTPGDRAKREQPWPTDMTVPCVTTRSSRGLHLVYPCRLYKGVITRTLRKGGTLLPVETITAQQGFDRGKGLCVCWDGVYGGERKVIPGAGDGHRW